MTNACKEEGFLSRRKKEKEKDEEKKKEAK